jgi:hypothetical protein
MCENITHKYLYKDKIKILEKKIKSSIDNPTLLIEQINLSDGRNINIIQDGVLLAGTKQRVVKLFFKKILKENPQIKTVLYAGTCNGYGAVATAYGAYKLGLNCEVFLSKTDSTENEIFRSRQINTLHALNAKIYLCPTYREARELEYSLSTVKVNNKWNTLPQYYISPMGLNDHNEIMTDLLSKQIIKASKNTLLANHPNPRIWLVTGSGGIAMSILKAFPNANLFILLTGGGKYKKKVYDWAKNNKNVFIITNENKLNSRDERKNRYLYYSSVKNYDDLIWPYIKKYGQHNDFIWNIASDDYWNEGGLL